MSEQLAVPRYVAGPSVRTVRRPVHRLPDIPTRPQGEGHAPVRYQGQPPSISVYYVLSLCKCVGISVRYSL